MHNTSEQNANMLGCCVFFFLISELTAATCTLCLLVHGMHMSLEITKKMKAGIMKHAFNKYKARSIVLKSKRGRFMNFNRP